MKSTDAPGKQAVPFGANGPREAITATTPSGSNQASYDQGFPPITMTLKSAGGLPPKGQDMNQILFEQSSFNRYFAAGGGYQYDSAFSSAISGYPAGARIPNSTNNGFWVNTIDDNTANPENSTAALTGWVPMGSYGSTSISGLSSASVTLSTLQASKDRITLSGALTTNINVVVPAWIKRWEVVNNCTGSFSVTIKTPSGSGVSISSGSSAIVQGDGVDIIYNSSPGSMIATRVFAASGSYTPTQGTKKIKVTAVGGGGGGGGSAATDANTRSCGGGGGAGCAIVSVFNVIDLAFPINITVGSSGTAGAAGGASGGNGGQGGSTSFGSVFSVLGGFGGGGGTLTNDSVALVAPNGGTPGQPSVGNILNIKGSAGLPGVIGGNAIVSGAGGASLLGGGGNPIATGASTAGDPGVYGGGGSGGISIKSSAIGRAGGQGGLGIVIIEEYA